MTFKSKVARAHGVNVLHSLIFLDGDKYGILNANDNKLLFKESLG